MILDSWLTVYENQKPDTAFHSRAAIDVIVVFSIGGCPSASHRMESFCYNESLDDDVRSDRVCGWRINERCF